VFTHRNPHLSNPDELRAVHSQGKDRGTACSGQTLEFTGVVAPSEVLIPDVAVRMEQRNIALRRGVDGSHSIRLVSIAGRARQAEILKFCHTALRARDNMLDLEDGDREIFRGTAVRTDMSKKLSDFPAQRNRM
jgi:hypothetical protein